jgi:hypothetical protein
MSITIISVDVLVLHAAERENPLTHIYCRRTDGIALFLLGGGRESLCYQRITPVQQIMIARNVVWSSFPLFLRKQQPRPFLRREKIVDLNK